MELGLSHQLLEVLVVQGVQEEEDVEEHELGVGFALFVDEEVRNIAVLSDYLFDLLVLHTELIIWELRTETISGNVGGLGVDKENVGHNGVEVHLVVRAL